MEIIKEGYTRVSDVLGIYQNYASVPREKLQKAQQVGTVIHSAIEGYYKGGFTPLPSTIAPYFDSFLSWATVCPIDVISSEERFYDPSLMITGRIDIFARIGDKTAVIDFKTGSWAHPDIWRLQGAFYRHLLLPQCWPLKASSPMVLPPEEFIFVQVKKDGSDPTIHEYKYEKEDWDMCLRSIESYRYLQKYRQ